MSKPRLLDLFCKAGGASMGYYRAGFRVTGVDRVPQKNYPFRFHCADALAYLAAHGHEYDVIAASPPCQAYSEATPVAYKAQHPMLIADVRTLLLATGRPYVIENVEGARAHMHDPLMLCGTMFNLSVWRHRYFEIGGAHVHAPGACAHRERPVTIGSGSNTRKTRGATPVALAREAMGIDWMTQDEIREAIPPAYTEWIGRQVIVHLQDKKEA